MLSDNLPASADTGGTVGYILKGFPRLSETFIANEIYLLEQLGTRIALFSIKQGDSGKQHAVIDKIRAPLRYLPKMTSLSGSYLLPWLLRNGVPYFQSHWRLVISHPVRYFKTFTHASVLAWQHRRHFWSLRKVFIKEFIQAGYVAREIIDNPDIHLLHAHFCHGATTVAWFVSELTGLPFSFTAHAKDIYQQPLNPGNLLQQKIHAAEFVTTCTHANHKHLTALPSLPNKIHTIYHGLDIQKFKPELPNNDAPSVPLILAVGRHVKKKGFIYLLEACDQLRALDVHFQCQIIGEAGDQTELLKRTIRNKGLESSVLLRNAVTQEELKGLYQQSTVFVLPCIITADGDRDGIPNVMAEAMATGLPIVSSPISGIPELVKDHVNGLLVPPRNVSALTTALQNLLGDIGLRTRLGSMARKTICQQFDSSVTTRSLHKLFHRSLQRESTA